VFWKFQIPSLLNRKQQRGRLVEHLGAVQARFEPNHAQLIVKSLEKLTKQAILEKSDPKVRCLVNVVVFYSNMSFKGRVTLD
jgi:thermostable 8-oxoguanine DNA glycosylase